MIWINSIDEYVSLQTIQNYCNSQNECEGKCPLFPLCCCMSKAPREWNLEHSPVSEGDSKPVDRKQCQKCEYFNNDKKRCSLRMCKDQPSLLDYIGNRF